MDRVVLVAVGGGVGSVLRYLTNGLAVRWLGLDFPYGTLIVNVVGSFLIGLVQALAEEAAVLPEPARLFLSVGVMGGFTTYSAFSFETVRLVRRWSASASACWESRPAASSSRCAARRQRARRLDHGQTSTEPAAEAARRGAVRRPLTMEARTGPVTPSG